MSQYDFTKTPISVDRLSSEISTSSIVTALDYISLFGAALSIYFKADLSETDQATLATIVTNHSGLHLSQNVVQTVNVNQSPAFASKTIVVNGVTKNLFKRFTGASFTLAIGENTFTWTQSAFAWVKFLGIELINGEIGDTCDVYVLDTATGTYSGYANYPLNQFAFNANIAPSFYRYVSEYDSDMYQNLQIKFVYNSVSAKTIRINFNMNEVQ